MRHRLKNGERALGARWENALQRDDEREAKERMHIVMWQVASRNAQSKRVHLYVVDAGCRKCGRGAFESP